MKSKNTHNPQGYRIIDEKLMDEISSLARNNIRQRMNYNFHQASDPVQRMLNAIEPESYVRPHRHLAHPKPESFIVLRGRFGAVIFDDNGNITGGAILSPGKSAGIDILPGIWHTVFSLEPGSIFFEVKEGPYISETDKEFAQWSPEDGRKNDYLKKLKQQLFEYLRSF